MTNTTTTKAAAIRDQVPHPIIDADGHFVEIAPIMSDEIVSYVEQIGGSELRERYLASGIAPLDTSSALRGRDSAGVRDNWLARPSWWGWQTENTLDRATCHLPQLLAERLDSFGIDLTILYPSMCLSFLDIADDELAGVVCRAMNRWLARMFEPYRDRMLVGGLVPMRTPELAIGELEYAVNELGLRTVVISGHVRRPIERVAREHPELAHVAYRLDTFGLDSDYDYDPFWARCMDLHIAPVSHSSVQHHRADRSISSYVYNHIGGLGTAHEALCKSLFLSGVTNRFPDLRIGFLEGGVGWACGLFADLVGHWSKRNREALQMLDPAGLDVDALMGYMASHGDEAVRASADRIREYFSLPASAPDELDEFAAVGINSVEELRDKFVRSFYFGCEADDPLMAWAFRDDINPAGARMRPIIGSDIAHWDVQDMTEPIEEAYELVEHGTITEDQFREFTYLNPLRLHVGMNPDFLAGTVCEPSLTEDVRREIAS